MSYDFSKNKKSAPYQEADLIFVGQAGVTFQLGNDPTYLSVILGGIRTEGRPFSTRYPDYINQLEAVMKPEHLPAIKKLWPLPSRKRKVFM